MTWFGSVVSHALEDDREVRLVETDASGFGVEVDGVVIVDGFPAQMLDVPLDDLDLDADAAEVVAEIERSKREASRERRQRREANRTDQHRVAEGATLAHRGGGRP